MGYDGRTTQGVGEPSQRPDTPDTIRGHVHMFMVVSGFGPGVAVCRDLWDLHAES
jgi:hypothetical protein